MVVLKASVSIRVNVNKQFSQYQQFLCEFRRRTIFVYIILFGYCMVVLTANADKVGGDGYGSSQHGILFVQEQWSVVYRYVNIYIQSAKSERCDSKIRDNRLRGRGSKLIFTAERLITKHVILYLYLIQILALSVKVIYRMTECLFCSLLMKFFSIF